MTARKCFRVLLWTAFVIYVFVVFSILFLGGRNGMIYEESFWEYLRHAVNPIPFKTIWGYVTDVIEQRWMVRLAVRNVLGNFILFYPMGFFLPCLSKRVRTVRKSLLISLCTILAAEIVQLIFRLGIFDIDDLILNMTGWLFGYFTLSIPLLRKRMRKIYFLED